MAYDWLGNVRELQNALERAIVLASGDEVDVRNVFAHLVFPPRTPSPVSPGSGNIDEGLFDLPLSEAKQTF